MPKHRAHDRFSSSPSLRRVGLALLLGASLTACSGPSQAPQDQSPDQQLPQTPAPTPTPTPAPTVNLPSPQTSWAPLFNGQNFGGWYRWLPSTGKDNDPKGVFKIENGALHVLDVTAPSAGQDQEFGYLSTNNSYANYQLRLQYKWGTKKFAPRLDQPRDAGVLYGAQSSDKAISASKGRVWPSSAEFQVKEGETGDLWLLEGINLTTTVQDKSADKVQYDPFGESYTSDNTAGGYLRLVKAGDHEKLTDWNDLTLIVSGDEAAQIVNGNVTVRASKLRAPDGSPLTSGRILLQAEGAEVYYRNIQLRPLAYFPAPSGATVLFGGQDTSAWQNGSGSPIDWPVQGGALTVKPSGNSNSPNDVRTKTTFGDFRLHLEFKVPVTSAQNEQDRGNSGVYLQGRYELQILDSFGKTLADKNDLGAIYGVRDASGNAALPAGTWQSYDVSFRAARWQGGQKTEDARVTAWLNGEKVQDNVDLPGSTFLGDPETDAPGPIRLQDHANKVQFRNIWIAPQ